MFLRISNWLIIFLAILSHLSAGPDKKMPNLLICLSENHAAHLFTSLDELGSSMNPTPNLSHFSQTGYFHPLTYCTDASTGNTGFSLFTGLPKNSDLTGFDPSKFLAHLFKSIGYETVFLGSWTWGNTPEYFGFKNWRILDDPEIFLNPKINHNDGDYILEGHSTDIITDLAIQWFHKDRTNQDPFLMIVSYQATQRPWIPPIRMIDHYNDEWFDLPDNFLASFSDRTPANKYQKMNITKDLDPVYDLFFESPMDTNISHSQSSILTKNLSSMNDEQKTAWRMSWKPQNEAFARESLNEESLGVWKFQRFIKNYLRCLLAMDENIGRLVNYVRARNEYGLNFIYTAERGRFSGDFGWFGSEWMYEPSARVPLLLTSFQGVNFPELDSDRIFLDKDLYKLLNFFTDLPRRPELYSWADSNRSGIGQNELYFTQHHNSEEYGVCPHHGLRKGRYKIIHYYPFNEWEFYDLMNDPKEEKNLFSDTRYIDLIKQYQKMLSQSAELSGNHAYKNAFSESWKREQRAPQKKSR